MWRSAETYRTGHSSALQERTCIFQVLSLSLLLLISVPRTSGQNVHASDRNVMPFEPVIYKPAMVNMSYQSAVEFDPRGMEHLYYITNLFLDLIQKDKIVPPGFNVTSDFSVIMEEVIQNWSSIVVHYIGVIIVSLLGLLFIILMPLIGLVFCCCRCGGKCGAETEPFDKKRDTCKRATLSVFLSTFVIIILFGVVCAFVTNEYLEQGVHDFPESVNISLDDTNLYLQNTNLELDNLLVKNYNDLEQVLENVLDSSGVTVKNQLGKVSEAIAIDNLTAIIDNFDKIKQDLSKVDEDTKALISHSVFLNRALNTRKTHLLNLLEECAESCQDVLEEYKIHKELSVQANFQELPDVKIAKNEIAVLLDQNIQEDVEAGKKAFDNIQKNVDDALKNNIPEIKRQIRKVGASLKTSVSNISDIIEEANMTLLSVKSDVWKADVYLNKYSYYRYYVDVGMCSLLLLIMLCMVFGLVCGICGKRPGNFYGDDCCNRGTGANFLIASVYLVFLWSFILMLLTTVHFIIGVVTEKIACESLIQPENSDILKVLDEQIQIYSGEKLSIQSIISNCHHNYSLYEVMKLENVVNISEVKNYKEEYGITEKIEELKDAISRKINISNIEILSNEAETKLQNFINSNVTDVNFTAYTVLQDEKITGINLLSLAETLNDTAQQLYRLNKDSISAQLYNDAIFLEALQRDKVQEMLKIIKRLKNNTAQLEEVLRFNKTSMKQALRDLITQTQAAEDYLHNNGQKVVVQLADTFAQDFSRHIDDYITYATDQIQMEVGKCWPVSRMYNATVIAFCNQIIDPLNGFWASVGWCLILFIPSILLSVSLSSLYKKTDPYPGPLVETEYMYDAYADQDNIPLANVRDKKGRHSNAQSYENQSGYMTDFSPHYRVREGRDTGTRGGYSSAAPYSTNDYDDRYRDMAPKNWDFPNGGPPQYSSNPSLANEYERPPPYYYPGPGNMKQ